MSDVGVEKNPVTLFGGHQTRPVALVPYEPAGDLYLQEPNDRSAESDERKAYVQENAQDTFQANP